MSVVFLLNHIGLGPWSTGEIVLPIGSSLFGNVDTAKAWLSAVRSEKSVGPSCIVDTADVAVLGKQSNISAIANIKPLARALRGLGLSDSWHCPFMLPVQDGCRDERTSKLFSHKDYPELQSNAVEPISWRCSLKTSFLKHKGMVSHL